jgi:hypothetical protein
LKRSAELAELKAAPERRHSSRVATRLMKAAEGKEAAEGDEIFYALLANYLDEEPDQEVSSELKQELSLLQALMAHALSADEGSIESQTPKTYNEAISGNTRELWQVSMREEMESLESNDTWELVPLPPGCKAIGTKWVYKIKIDVNGTPNRMKSRCVALGYRQKQGVDFTETFAPVGNFGSIRLLLALAASRGWDTGHLDVKTAFLHGEIDQDNIYVKQPQGFVIKGKEDFVLRLKRSLYGIRQAPRIWWKTIHEKLIQLGFMRSKRDPCLYTKIGK